MYCSRLPPIAAAAISSSLFVVFPIAETTTTGRRASRARTMPATRVMAAADSTEVPPNFMTIIIEPRQVPRRAQQGVWGNLDPGNHLAQIVGQPILAAAGFQPALAQRRLVHDPKKPPEKPQWAR